MRGIPGAFGVSVAVHAVPLSLCLGWAGTPVSEEGGGCPPAVVWSPASQAPSLESRESVELGRMPEPVLLPATDLRGPGSPVMGPCPPPPYPEEARRRGVEGSLEVEIVVGPDGRLASARLAASSGSLLLDRATLEWVRRRWGPFTDPFAPRAFRRPVRFVLSPS